MNLLITPLSYPVPTCTLFHSNLVSTCVPLDTVCSLPGFYLVDFMTSQKILATEQLAEEHGGT